MKQAYPPMVFDFGEGNGLTSPWSTFKYEEMCGYFRIYGLLEHPAEDCHGPPDMSAAG